MKQDKDFFEYLRLMYKLHNMEVFNPKTFWDKSFHIQKCLWEWYKLWRDEY